MSVRALLFDFDGVLADTENIHVAAWQRTLETMGWEAADELCALSMELDDRVFLARVFEQEQVLDGDIPGWVLKKQKLTLELLADSPRIYPGVPELIERVRGRMKLAVVTTTWRDNVTTVLRASGLLSAFEVVVAKEDAAATKPDPEPYRLAVRKLGVLPKQAVALEDSAVGLTSAFNAGVAAIAVGHRKPPGDWHGSAPYLPDLRDASRVLRVLGFDDLR